MSARDLFKDMGIPIPPPVNASGHVIDESITRMLMQLEIGRLRSGIRIVAATRRISDPELARLLDELADMDLTLEQR